jgi:hypothetical protein
MRRLHYYEIPKEAFLFKQVIDSTQIKPEEPVRQWCAFELIRAYAFLISDLVFESPVKVGSKNYRIDILVRRKGSPWIVVECKEREWRKGAIEQAISYADAREVRAEYAVYTNGADWVVRRKINDQWMPVPDLPWPDATGAHGHFFREILDGLDAITPLIYKLDGRLSETEAECFLTLLQKLFHAQNLFAEIADRHLCNAADNLLRVLSVRGAHREYQFEKLSHACNDWKRYAEQAGLPPKTYEVHPGDPLYREMGILRHELKELVKDATTPWSGDLLLLRLTIALLDYGENSFRKRNQFMEIGQHVHQALRDFLNMALKLQINTSLPDHIDTDGMEDVKLYCSDGWEGLLENIRKMPDQKSYS